MGIFYLIIIISVIIIIIIIEYKFKEFNWFF